MTLDPLNALSPEIGSPRTLSTRLTAPKEEPAPKPPARPREQRLSSARPWDRGSLQGAQVARARQAAVPSREGVGARVAVSEASPYAVEHADELRRNRSQGRPAATESRSPSSGARAPTATAARARRVDAAIMHARPAPAAEPEERPDQRGTSAVEPGAASARRARIIVCV